MLRFFPALFLLASCVQAPASDPGPVASRSGAVEAAVVPGIEVFLADIPSSLRGKRVGLITNHSATDRARNMDVDLIAKHKDLKLVALFAPEHGLRGVAAAGLKIED